jgi:hypothetical protein
MRWFLVTANVPSSLILVTLMMEVLSSSETLLLTRATRRNIPEDAILHSHRSENQKSYITAHTLLCGSSQYFHCSFGLRMSSATHILPFLLSVCFMPSILQKEAPES